MKRKFRLGDIVYSTMNPVQPYRQRKLTYTITQVCENCYEALSCVGEYINIPFPEEYIWERDVIISGYSREGEYVTTNDIKIEEFSFQYIPEDKLDWIDIEYKLQLGDKIMRSCISEWSVDYEKIRHDLEHLIYHGETEIHLNLEDSPTIIKLTRTFVQDKEKFHEFGTYHGWTDLMRIEVYPNEFIEEKYSPIFGYAKYIETIHALYEGLLDAIRAYPEVNEESPDKNRESMYLGLHSTKIEAYIENCPYSEKWRMTDYYRIDINTAHLRHGGYLLPTPKTEYIQKVAEKAADIFLSERQQGKDVKDAHKAAEWAIYLKLDRYRIKL